MAGTNVQPGDKCKRTVSMHYALCELETPCPLHDAKPPGAIRTLAESVRYTVERIAATLIALWIARKLLGL